MVTLAEAFQNTRVILCGPDRLAVEQTVADALVRSLARGAEIRHTGPEAPGTIRLSVAASSPDGAWMKVSLDRSGTGTLAASHPHWLYALCCLLSEEWLDRDVAEFAGESTIRPTFSWLRNMSDFIVGGLRHARNFDREDYFRSLARCGFSHVSINGLKSPGPFESGPRGDVYSWFYDYSPDLDQFVDSSLISGVYPVDYLRENLALLRENAALARKYGLTPGLHINSPRSMPEDFWRRYAYLRGARIDHPRESFLPRYTLSLAHPRVREHYRELLRNIFREVPDIGFIHLWTNDSGSGFEFVSSLYAGRNGGPYLIREWKSDEQIAAKAAENALGYFFLLRDEGRRANTGFRLICDLGSFHAERDRILKGTGNGIDIMEFADVWPLPSVTTPQETRPSDCEAHTKADAADGNVLGVPFPRLLFERLKACAGRGGRHVLTAITPRSLAPFDINGEVVRAAQVLPQAAVESTLRKAAERWAGSKEAHTLIGVWDACDAAIRAYPADIQYSTFAFPWFRLWVRPFVPNIDAIPEDERSYYERYLLATFNNPARVDLNNDMLWNFHSVEEAAERKLQIDARVLPHLDGAVTLCRETLNRTEGGTPGGEVFRDLLERVRAYRCFVRTMRNLMAWTESVHGYIHAKDPDKKSNYRSLSRAMLSNELANARELLDLWNTRTTSFMPVSSVGETLHSYGDNFGELVRKKIALMESHADDEPYIDPEYMWRTVDMSVASSQLSDGRTR